MYIEGKKTKDSQVIWQETKEFSSRNLPAFYQMFHDNYYQDVPLLKIGYFFSGNLVLIWEGEVVGQFSLFCSSQQGVMNSWERRKLRVFWFCELCPPECLQRYNGRMAFQKRESFWSGVRGGEGYSKGMWSEEESGSGLWRLKFVAEDVSIPA